MGWSRETVGSLVCLAGYPVWYWARTDLSVNGSDGPWWAAAGAGFAFGLAGWWRGYWVSRVVSAALAVLHSTALVLLVIAVFLTRYGNSTGGVS